MYCIQGCHKLGFYPSSRIFNTCQSYSDGFVEVVGFFSTRRGRKPSPAYELEKKRQYEQRVREVEHASFTPLVLSATGGIANQATVFYKRLACCLAMKWDQPYSSTMSWL